MGRKRKHHQWWFRCYDCENPSNNPSLSRILSTRFVNRLISWDSAFVISSGVDRIPWLSLRLISIEFIIVRQSFRFSFLEYCFSCMMLLSICDRCSFLKRLLIIQIVCLDDRQNPYRPTYTFPDEYDGDLERMENYIRKAASEDVEDQNEETRPSSTTK